MVSRRAAAALGLRLLLAQGWRSHLGGSRSLIAEDGKDYGYTAERRAAVSRGPDAPPPGGRLVHHHRVRRRLLLPVEGAPAAGQRRSARSEARRTRSSATAWRAFSNRAWASRSATCFRCAAFPTRSGTPRWTSQPWFLASKQMFLIPGDSPMGYRLPLESLPWTKPEDVRLFLRSRSVREARRASRQGRNANLTFSPRRPLRTTRSRPPNSAKPPEKGESAPWISRPALCVEPRDGKLFVFMPPVEYLADYLDLVAAIEDTAAYLKMPVMLEGYTPPSDPRIAVLKVTPDPGVIEVNIHPAASWDELVANTTDALRSGAPEPSGHGEIHAGRAALRHRRRQSRRDRRPDSGGQRLSCAVPICCAA